VHYPTTIRPEDLIRIQRFGAGVFIMKIYVGNLPFSASQDQIRDLFSEHGEVGEVTLIMDRETGRPKGFGFVEMPDSSQANKALDALNGLEFGGRQIKVNEARPMENRGGGGGGGGGFRGGNRGGFRR